MTSSHVTITEMLRLILESSDEAVEVLTDLLRRSIIQVADIQHSIHTVKKRHCANKADIAAESCNTFTVMPASCQPRSPTREVFVETKRSNEVKQNTLSNAYKDKAGIPLHIPCPTNIDHNGNSSSPNPPKRTRITDTINDDDDNHSAAIVLDQPVDTEASLDRKWIVHFKELQAHKAKHGDCLVPYKFAHNPQLGYWVSTQRTQYKKSIEGKPSKMTSKHKDALNSLGFEWSLVNRVHWDVRFEEMRQYKAKYGDCLVPQSFPDNPQLGNWINSQRAHYKKLIDGKPSSMTSKRIDALNGLGFEWSLRKFVDWDVRLEELRQYKEKYGNCLVPKSFPDNPQLGQWINFQRIEHKKFIDGKPSQITSKRIDSLNGLGFKWQVRKVVAWVARLEELRQYKAKYGDCLVQQSFADNSQLVLWVSTQRSHYKRFCSGEVSSMNEERIEALNSLGFEWSLRN